MEELLRWVYAIELHPYAAAYLISIALSELALVVVFFLVVTRDKGEKK
jgi:hypothetical protein